MLQKEKMSGLIFLYFVPRKVFWCVHGFVLERSVDSKEMKKMTKYLCTEKIKVEEIVDKLVDFSTLGALSIPGILTPEAREELVAGISASRYFFTAVEREIKKSGVIQEMQTFYVEKIVEEDLPQRLQYSLNQLTPEYAEIYEKIAAKANFSSASFNSIGIHYYPIGSAGVKAHQD